MIRRLLYLLLSTLHYVVIMFALPATVMYAFLALMMLFSHPDPVVWPLPVPRVGTAIVALGIVGILWLLLSHSMERCEESIKSRESVIPVHQLIRRYEASRVLESACWAMFGVAILLLGLAPEFHSFTTGRVAIALMVLASVLLLIGWFRKPFDVPAIDQYKAQRVSKTFPLTAMTSIAILWLLLTLLLQPVLLPCERYETLEWHGLFSGLFRLLITLPRWLPWLLTPFSAEIAGPIIPIIVGVALFVPVLATIWAILAVPALNMADPTYPSRGIRTRCAILLLPLLLLPEYLGIHYLSPFQSVYIHLMTIMSAWAVGLSARDKYIAMRNQHYQAAISEAEDYGDSTEGLKAKLSMRISEMSLHTVELLGGWPGAWFSMEVFRHKSQKVSYHSAFRVAIIAHCTLISLALWCTYAHAILSHR